MNQSIFQAPPKKNNRGFGLLTPEQWDQLLGSYFFDMITPAVGKKIMQLIEKKQMGLFDLVAEESDELIKVMGEAKFDKLAQFAEEASFLEDQILLASRVLRLNFSGKIAAKVVDFASSGESDLSCSEYLQQLDKNNYILVNVPGLSFNKVDEQVLANGLDPFSLLRMDQALVFALKEAQKQAGGMCTEESFKKILRQFLLGNVSPEKINQWIEKQKNQIQNPDFCLGVDQLANKGNADAQHGQLLIGPIAPEQLGEYKKQLAAVSVHFTENLSTQQLQTLNKGKWLDGWLQAALSRGSANKVCMFASYQGPSGPVQCVCDTQMFWTEELIARHLLHLSRQDSAIQLGADPEEQLDKQLDELEKKLAFGLKDEQRQAIKVMCTNRLSIIFGKPGTGKTTLLKSARDILEQSQRKVLYLAPTGKAAKRMSQSLGRQALTIARALQMSGASINISVSKSGIQSAVDQLNKKPKKQPRSIVGIANFDVIVIDESSMIDMFTMARLLESVGPKTQLIFMGDPNQLPSVGPGRVLKDMIDSGQIAKSFLVKVMRQSETSNIQTAADALMEGKVIDLSDKNKDCVLIPESDERQLVQRIQNIISNNLKKNPNFDVHSQLQILTPSNEGVLGVNQLNLKMQHLLNPSASHKKEYTWSSFKDQTQTIREMDKVIQKENMYNKVVYKVIERSKIQDELQIKDVMMQTEPPVIYELNDPLPHQDIKMVAKWVLDNKNKPDDWVIVKKKGIFNGDIGKVEKIKESNNGYNAQILINFDDTLVMYDEKEIKEMISLAYALTIHKAQGSEADVIMQIAHYSVPYPLKNKNAFYTGITRGKKKCLIFGDYETLSLASKNDINQKRTTRLAQLVSGQIPLTDAPEYLRSLSEENGLRAHLKTLLDSMSTKQEVWEPATKLSKMQSAL